MIPLVLLLTTAATTFYSGYLTSGTVSGGFLFSVSLLAILGAHEMGHYLYGRKYGVSISLPHFIPVPPFISPIGTFGAFIRIRSRIRNRRELFDIGAAGPFAGVIAALPILFTGLLFSEVVAEDSDRLSEMGSGISLGNSVVFILFLKMAVGAVPQGHEVVLHPLAFAGWIGLFVTALNLMPSGQLDGGHLVYCVFSERWHRRISTATVVLLAIMGMGTAPLLDLASSFGLVVSEGSFPGWLVFEGWTGWLVWAILLLLLGKSHATTARDDMQLGLSRKTLALAALAVFACCFSPVPFRVVEFG